MLLEIFALVRGETPGLAQSASLLQPPIAHLHPPRRCTHPFKVDMKTRHIAASASSSPIATINFFVARRTEG